MFAVCVPAPVTRLPALRPAHALLARIPLGLRPSLHRLRCSCLHRRLLRRVVRFVRRLHSYYGEVRLPTPVHHRLRLLTFPMRTRSTHGLWSDAGYPRFRRDPFARDVALDPGGTTMPRIAALHMLRSTMKTVSAPAISSFRGSLPHPTQQLCTLRGRRRGPLPQPSLPGGPLRPSLGRTLHRLIAPALPGAFPHSITSSAATSSLSGIWRPGVLAVLRLITSSYLVGACTGRSPGFSPL